MQKHFRAGIGNAAKLAAGSRIFAEALNPHFGYFYTVKSVLASQKTKYQDLQLLDTQEFGKVLVIDGITQAGDRNDSHYHEPMVHPAFCSHRRPERVLVIGGGDGGVLREVLKYPVVKRVDLAEIDGEVIRFANQYLPRIHGGAFGDKRVQVTIADGRRFVEEHRGEFDIVIMDMTDPSGPSKLLYTKEFFAAVTRSLRNPGGIFIMHSESPISRPAAFACIQHTLRASFKNVTPLYIYIPMYGTLWSITLCSPTVDCSRIRPAAIDRRLARYGIGGLEVYSGATHTAMLTTYPYITRLLTKRSRLITDARPDFPDDFSCPGKEIKG